MTVIKEWIKLGLTSIGALESAASFKRSSGLILSRMRNKGRVFFEITPGLSIRIDVRAKAAFQHFRVNPNMNEEINSFVRFSAGKERLLDIGALYGIFSLTFLELNKKSAACAVDPSPFCVKMLQRNKNANPNYDFRIYPYAIGENNGKLNMHFEWHHLVAEAQEQDSDKSLVRDVYSIDSFVKDQSFNPDVIKIDVEGFEYGVLKGGADYLSQNSPLIFLELHGDRIKNYGSTVQDIISLLRSLGYRLYHLNGTEIEQPEVELDQFCYRIICSKDKLLSKE